MRRVIIIAAITFAGCMTADIAQHWRHQASKAAKFDTGCQTMVVVAEQPEGTTATRYRLKGCGRTMVYRCTNKSDRHQDGLGLAVTGGRTIDADCKPMPQ